MKIRTAVVLILLVVSVLDVSASEKKLRFAATTGGVIANDLLGAGVFTGGGGLAIAYPVSIIIAAVVAGVWSILFGLPSAKVKGFYLILTTMAAQFVTVDFVIAQYVSRIGGRGQAFSLPPGTIKIGPWMIDADSEVHFEIWRWIFGPVITKDHKVYFLMLALVILCVIALANLLRSRVGRAWVAIRDNDISAEVMGINVVKYKLLAFFVAGFMGGIAGSFWISNLAAVSYEHFPWFWSLWLVGVILIGGVGSLHGAIFVREGCRYNECWFVRITICRDSMVL